MYYYYIKPISYFTDYYIPYSSASSSSRVGNEDSYYETFEYVVKEENGEYEVNLAPMWSKLRVELNNIKSMNIPQEADYVEVFVYPYPTGYSLQTKMANCYPLEEDRGEEMYISAGGQLMQMKVSDFITENNREAQAFVAATSDTPAIYLRFHQSSAPGIPRKDISCLKLTDLPLAENNKEYYVHGEIPSDPNNEYDFKISKTEFTGEKVDVPFSGIQ